MSPRALLPLLFLATASCEARRLERQGISKCDQGTALVRARHPMIVSRSLTTTEEEYLKSELRRASVLIREGLALLEKAFVASGGKASCDTTTYCEALLVIRKKLADLGP